MREKKFSLKRIVFALVAVIASIVGLFILSAELFERKIIEANLISEVINKPGVFVATKDRSIDRFTVRAARDGLIYGIEDHFLYVSDDHGDSFRQIGVLPKANPTLINLFRDLVARHPLYRAFRKNHGPPNLVVLSTGTILIFYDHIYRSDNDGKKFEIVGMNQIKDLSGIFHHGIAVDSLDQVFFGDYKIGPRPQVIRVIAGRNDGKDWEICHTFGNGEVFHVHSISYDPHDDALLVATGDRDAESGLYYLDQNCEGVEKIGGGAQSWRLIAPLYTPSHVIWGSDDDHSGSHIYAMPRGGQAPEAHHFIGKPAYFAARLEDGTMVMSTTYEPDSPFTRNAKPNPTTTLWVSRDGFQWWVLDEFPWLEQELPWGRSRAQAVVVAAGGSSPYFFVTPFYTKDGFVTYRYRIDWEEGAPILNRQP